LPCCVPLALNPDSKNCKARATQAIRESLRVSDANLRRHRLSPARQSEGRDAGWAYARTRPCRSTGARSIRSSLEETIVRKVRELVGHARAR